MPNNKTFVISLGGSVMYPQTLDETYIKKFRDFLIKNIKAGFKFAIVAGGGQLARSYQQTALKISKISNDERDWLGIETIKLNALLLKTILGNRARLISLNNKNNSKIFNKYPIIITCFGQPGHSSDLTAVQTAVDLKISTVINLGKPHFVYTANPDKDPSAKPLAQLSWQDYFKIIPSKWTPGLNTPFDPVASRLAQKNKITVIVADGRNLPNFQKIIANQKFAGTTITN